MSRGEAAFVGDLDLVGDGDGFGREDDLFDVVYSIVAFSGVVARVVFIEDPGERNGCWGRNAGDSEV